MATRTTEKRHQEYLHLALGQAALSVATPTAFCVGCVIVAADSSRLLSSGYSRELPGNTHAEQCAIDKYLARPDARPEDLVGASIYTTMEPCSVRLSGNTPCVERVIQAGFANVYIGVEEPADFVECEGTRRLKESGAKVWLVEEEGLREACLREARRGH